MGRRIGICARCNREATLAARRMCASCNVLAKRYGELDRYPREHRTADDLQSVLEDIAFLTSQGESETAIARRLGYTDVRAMNRALREPRLRKQIIDLEAANEQLRAENERLRARLAGRVGTRA